MTSATIGRTAAAGVLLLTAGCFAENRMGVNAPETTASAAAQTVASDEAAPVREVADAPKRKPAKAPSKLRTVSATPMVARGDVVRAPKWQVGDRWRYNDGYGLEVVTVEDDLVTMRRLDDPGQWIMRRGFLREMAQSATTLRQVTFRSVPASAGMFLSKTEPLVFTREYTANRRTLVHSTSWVVEGQERITVPAGTYDTHVIVMRTRNSATGWTGFERWWYAPEVRNYVRMEFRYGQQPIGSRVMVSFQPAGTRLSSAGSVLDVPAPRQSDSQ